MKNYKCCLLQKTLQDNRITEKQFIIIKINSLLKKDSSLQPFLQIYSINNKTVCIFTLINDTR